MPTQTANERTLLATTTEWNRFVKHLRDTRQGAVASLVKIDQNKPVNKIVLPTEQAFKVLAAAGVAY